MWDSSQPIFGLLGGSLLPCGGIGCQSFFRQEQVFPSGSLGFQVLELAGGQCWWGLSLEGWSGVTLSRLLGGSPTELNEEEEKKGGSDL